VATVDIAVRPEELVIPAHEDAGMTSPIDVT
jgi:hypothetical protein